jgi:eukaryotic-like serine/threonine-protein kinase
VTSQSGTHLEPGQRLDRYELLCPLAQGGMAHVWVARFRGKRGFEKLVAIKTILAQHAKDPQFQAMFLDEARLIASIKHPNVAEIFDLGEERDILYFVLELITGDSLSALRRVIHGDGQRFPLAAALRIASDACAGLHAAHELRDDRGEALGVVHRDVSPANILVSTSGVAKLIDFGIAKAVHRLSEETASGVIKGKLSYMAPEQAAGRTIDRRADLYAIGAVLYHLLGGKPPVQGDNQLQVLNRLVNGAEPPPLPGVPPPVSAILVRALRREPTRRFATAIEMQRAIEDALAATCPPTTSADVAALVNEHLRERLETRKKTIARAIEGADARSRLAAELSAAAEQTDSTVAGPAWTPSAAEAPAPPTEEVEAQSGRPSLTEGTLGRSAITMTSEPRRGPGRILLVAGVVAIAAASAAAVLIASKSPPADSEPAVSAPAAPLPQEPAPPASTAAATASAADAPAADSGVSSETAKAVRRSQPPPRPKPKRGVLEVFDERR